MLVWEPFDRCHLLTAEPFGLRVMNVKVWTKNILHGHFFHEGEVIVLTCAETHKQTDYSSSLARLFNKERITPPFHMLVEEIRAQWASHPLLLNSGSAADLAAAGSRTLIHLRAENQI